MLIVILLGLSFLDWCLRITLYLLSNLLNLGFSLFNCFFEEKVGVIEIYLDYPHEGVRP